MDRFSVSIPEELSEEIEELYGEGEEPYDNRSMAIAQLCESGLAWRLAFQDYDDDPAAVREELEQISEYADHLESELEAAKAERREAVHLAHGVVDRDRGLLDRLADVLHGRDPHAHLPELGADDEPEQVDALPVDREER
jgi:Arc/MetJ-type ribon-helix-helix transcriptional regulator